MSDPTIREADRAGFTPGPWWLIEDFDRIGARDQRVYSVHGNLPSGPVFAGIARLPADVGDAMLEANAHLIAAAPALFEALKAFVAQYDAIPDEVLTSRMHESPAVMRIVRARSALALAQPKADQGET